VFPRPSSWNKGNLLLREGGGAGRKRGGEGWKGSGRGGLGKSRKAREREWRVIPVCSFFLRIAYVFLQ